jgi:error-prone DNA polymerase
MTAPLPYGSLRTRSHFSFLRGASSPEELARRAAAIGHTALCLTDMNGVYGAVRLQKACRDVGIKPLIGTQICISTRWVTVIAMDAGGYSSVNRLLTRLHGREEARFDSVEALQTLERCAILVDDASMLAELVHLPCTIYAALDHQRRPGDGRRARALAARAADLGIASVVAPDVCYAEADDYRTYDVMTCTRLGITVFDPHPERPVNDEQHLRSTETLRSLFTDEAFRATAQLIDEACFDILPGYVTPPSARLPAGAQADDVLREQCEKAFPLRYGPDASHPLPDWQGIRGEERARRLLEHELTTIAELGLSDFFLVVKEIVDEAKRRRIRCSGRGSAANSIVAYLLGITGVCPIRHHLLFERFLHRGRKGTPDIDVDFDSDRRQDVIDWMERRFGQEQTAMTATLITYRIRMAIRDAAKALGWPMDIVNKLSKAVPGYTNKESTSYRHDIVTIVGDSPMVDTLFRIVDLLHDRPRHLGLHSGGMILSARPLHEFTPVQRSANGVSVVQFDKDDVEAMGLVKFDVLGLRMLACISEAVELVERYEGVSVDIDEIPLDDPKIFDLIKSGQTLGLFQIESQGQMHLLAQHQPECFDDLVTEVALFRPGPLQGGMVNPYVRRRKGLEATTYLHPDLEPLLRDTLGIVLFQEQVLEIAHRFAGMPLDEADDFRALISKNRDAAAMASMRETFLQGAQARGVDRVSAEAVYEKVSHFVGYGFCRSHAAAFAKIVYQSAYLKLYHPAAYLAAFMQHRPGFYNLMTLEEEARRFGVDIVLPDLNRSETRYSLVRTRNDAGEFRLAILKPLSSITHVTEDRARMIVWERARAPFTSADDVVQRLDLPSDVLESIALSGAMDALEGNARKALWKVGVAGRRKERHSDARHQEPALFTDLPLVVDDDLPELPSIRAQERLAFDYLTHGAARLHPMTLYRRMLNDLEVRPIAVSKTFNAPDTTASAPRGNDTGMDIITAGIVILRQSPPTAHGVLFVTLEDETGFVQCVVQPRERELFNQELRHAALIVKARVHAVKNWRGLVVRDVRVLTNVIGGYHGHPAMYGGTDRMELEVFEQDSSSSYSQ